MKIQYPSGTREDWVDRNASQYFIGNSSAFGPHAATERGTYTVPAGKRAIVNLINLSITRSVAAGTLGTAHVEALIDSQLSEGLGIRTYLHNNAVGAQSLMNFASQVVLEAGDTVTVATADFSVTGTLLFTFNIGILVFDA